MPRRPGGSTAGADALCGLFFWTLGYDTIYAHQDKEDDALIGINFSRVKLGSMTKYWIYIFYGLAFVLFLAAGLMARLGVSFALFLVVAGLHLDVAGLFARHARPLLCLKIFKSNRDAGALIAAAYLLGTIIKF